MKRSSLDERRAFEIAKRRALGFTMEEIGDDLDVSAKTVSNYLRVMNREAEKKGVDEVWWRIVNDHLAERFTAAIVHIIAEEERRTHAE